VTVLEWALGAVLVVALAELALVYWAVVRDLALRERELAQEKEKE
jgi:hypothetical protein